MRPQRLVSPSGNLAIPSDPTSSKATLAEPTVLMASPDRSLGSGEFTQDRRPLCLEGSGRAGSPAGLPGALLAYPAQLYAVFT
jgi:hypothetical protein